jgi:hypothetical protein
MQRSRMIRESSHTGSPNIFIYLFIYKALVIHLRLAPCHPSVITRRFTVFICYSLISLCFYVIKNKSVVHLSMYYLLYTLYACILQGIKKTRTLWSI